MGQRLLARGAASLPDRVRYLVGTVVGQFNYATFLGTCSPGACQHSTPTG